MIIVAEELVKASVIRSDPNRTIIPGLKVDAVVIEPFAAHPSYAQGYYDRDNQFYVDCYNISKDCTSMVKIRENLSWHVKVSDSIKTTDSPIPGELRFIIEDLDSDKIYLN